MTRDRSDGLEVTYKSNGALRAMRFEPLSGGEWERVELAKHAVGGTWRVIGREVVTEVSLDGPVGTSTAGP
jgi:hypothetical protein